MKALTCEMCGSTNLVKQDGVFVCQSCGTKYSVEEAKRMMVDGTVDVKGTVKVDTSDELKNLYEIARRAKDSGNSENAAKYYDMILVKDPSSWEANFYVVYYKAMSCTIGQIENAGYSVMNCLPSVVDLVQANVPEDEQELVYTELMLRCCSIAHLLSEAAESTYNDIDGSIRFDYLEEFSNRTLAAMFIPFNLADILEERYKGKYGQLSAEGWKVAIEIYKSQANYLYGDKSGLQKILDEYGEKVRKYEPNYVTPSIVSPTSSYSGDNTESATNGCYVATAIYGSYDCPQVWTLRRYRDFTLDKTIPGRLFIKTYYAFSPTLVKWFGNTRWFKIMWKPVLDKMVKRLQIRGVEATPYQDKY